MQKIEDLTCKAQQRQRQGRTLEAIRLFEQALEHRIDLHGPESSSVRKACDSLSDVLNGAALKHLQSEEYEEAKKLLQKAEMLTGPDDLISAVTYNNIACYYRRCVSRKPRLASPRLTSPRLASPRLASPRLACAISSRHPRSCFAFYFPCRLVPDAHSTAMASFATG